MTFTPFVPVFLATSEVASSQFVTFDASCLCPNSTLASSCIVSQNGLSQTRLYFLILREIKKKLSESIVCVGTS